MITKETVQKAYQAGTQKALMDAGFLKQAGATEFLADPMKRRMLLMALGTGTGAGLGAISAGSEPFGSPGKGALKGGLAGGLIMGGGLLGGAGAERLYAHLRQKQIQKALRQIVPGNALGGASGVMAVLDEARNMRLAEMAGFLPGAYAGGQLSKNMLGID
jgi:hypothetical protein